MSKKQIFVLLSSKSAGSTALQSYLSHNFDIKTVRETEHFEKETLYWTKAASILGMNQAAMHRSKVPYARDEALASLQRFLNSNGIDVKLANPTKADLFDLFFDLACRTGELMVEKSPHHLFNETNIQLILEFKDYIRERALVKIIGLVRNPLDTIYSAWDRWRFKCADFELEWIRTYNNLINMTQHCPEVRIFRYEDLVTSSQMLDDYLVNNCRLRKFSDKFLFKADSMGKWRNVPAFRHQLSNESVKLAHIYGYDNGLINPKPRSGVWNLSENLNEWKFRVRAILRRT